MKRETASGIPGDADPGQRQLSAGSGIRAGAV